MAAHDDLVLIINQLLQGLDKIGDSLSVVKAIGEDVKAMKEEIAVIKRRVVKIEERIGNIDCQPSTDISDKVKITEKTLVSMEKTMNKLILTMENASRNSIINETSKFAFDEIFRGKNIEISADQRTASRLRPLEDNGRYAGVVSNIPLRNDVVFEIRIDETIDMRTDLGIALGVVVRKEEEIRKSSSICYHVPGSYCITSHGEIYIVTSRGESSLSTADDQGKSHIYMNGGRISTNAYNMDTRDLPVGTTLGIVRRSNGAIHFLLNGEDMGPAFKYVQEGVYAFVDVMYYVSKITIIN